MNCFTPHTGIVTGEPWLNTDVKHSQLIAAFLAALALAAVAPASVSADANVTYTVDGGELDVAADGSALTLSVFQFTDLPNCEPTCTSRTTLSSSDALVETPPTTRCSYPGGTDTSRMECRPIASLVEVTGSPAADSVTTSGDGQLACPDPVVRLVGLGGADVLRGGCAADRLDGGEGRDTLDAGAGADELDGGAEADALAGGPGTDALRGGDGRDQLAPGTGSDIVIGGESVDRVSYEERTASVTVTLGGIADDGEAGEGDTVAEDVEDVIGGAGGDSITGSAATNDIDAGPGADVIDAGAGADTVEAGAGDDTIAARDGAPDRIICGEGSDSVVGDAIDLLDGCEAVDLSRALLPDVDNDGLAASAGDCADTDPGRRPGFPDRPGDGIDQDCAAGDAPFPRILTGLAVRWRFANAKLIVTQLELIDLPDQARVEVRCRGKGCFKGAKEEQRPKGAEQLDLLRFVRGSKLGRGARLQLRIFRPDTVGKQIRLIVRKPSQQPKVRFSCLRPADGKPVACSAL